MKLFKKMMALVIAMVMVVAMSIPAMAADTGSITINKGESKISDNHTYTAYQIFSGTLSDDKTTLTNLQWAEDVDDSVLLPALKAVPTAETSPYKDCTTAQDVADVLSTFGDNSDEIKAFNDIIAANLAALGAADGTSTGGVISGLADGYYFVKDTTIITEPGTDALSAYIVRLLGTATIFVKTDAPSIEKKIVENSAEVDANNGSVGDDVNYILKSAVPDMTDFRAYEFFMEDDVSDGLTLNKSDTAGGTFTVKVGDTTLTENTDYKVTYGTDADDFIIKFLTIYDRFKSEAAADADFAAGTAITVEYSAKINKDAVIGINGNPNQVRLIYTNDANWDGSGTPDDDQPVGPSGVTPWDIVKTYVTEIDILKRDGDTQLPLKNVTFDISGDALNEVITYTVAFAEKAEADFEAGETKYYKLADGTYTTTAPTSDTTDYYDATATGKLYAKTETVSSTQGKTSNKISMTTGDDGTVKFTGLGAGTYTIHETAPDKYNAVDDITVRITCTEPQTITDGTETCTWDFVVGGSHDTSTDGNHIVITIDNFKGATLPSTGGIGTTIFYVLGAILVLGGTVVLVTRRRMAA